MPEKEPIGVVGVGWVGLVTAACFAELGHPVYARDIVEDKVESLRRGEVPIHEPALPELVASNASRLHFTTDLSEVTEHARLLFCCVDTPPTYSGDADLSRVEQVVAELGESGEHALVMKSTVPVGTGRSIQRRRAGLGYVANPEFLKEGSAVDDFMHPDRVVIGADDGSEGFAERVRSLYEPLGGRLVSTDVASAEMIKLASNAFLATKISFINEIANVSEEVGADVEEVARGMGLDDRIGPKFLRAGIGWGGSCLAGDETVLVKHHRQTTLLTLERLWRLLEEEGEIRPGVIAPTALEVLSWAPGRPEPRFLPVRWVTRRDYEGDSVEVRTTIGRRVRCTPDHPWPVGDGKTDELRYKLASELSDRDWIPLAQGQGRGAHRAALAPLVGAAEAAALSPGQVSLRPQRPHMADVVARPIDAPDAAGLPVRGSAPGTATDGNLVRSEIALDDAFWRVVGLYLAVGHTRIEGSRYRLCWSFHAARAEHLVDEVVAFWLRHGVVVRAYDTPTAKLVAVSSPLVGAWWTRTLGLGRTRSDQRLPDLVWDRPEEDKWALLSGLWEGDGSWSPVNGGPSASLELGTVSEELADGILRLLGDLGVVASRRIGTSKLARSTHWIGVSGAEQVERAIRLVPRRDRAGMTASIAGHRQHDAATGYRRPCGGPAWARIAAVDRSPFSGPVYSLEVPGAHTFVTSGGVVTHNCFPKDVQALKQLAGNTGYHFQLLTAVIEVNELQKRRTISKLQKHLGSLVGKHIALLGVAFKPNTDDIREATSLVLAGRLQGEGAHVRAYDPVAADRAIELLGAARICSSALEALEGADAAVLVTEWPEFRELDWGEVRSRMRTPLIVDGRNFLDREALREAGFTYEGIGR
jgi:UDPglucose 6-dehydrogenase